MNPAEKAKVIRVLVVDDNPAIHEDLRKLLVAAQAPTELGSLVAEMLGNTPPDQESSPTVFDVDSAYQGQEALSLVEAALVAGRPYALAFVDMRMPPGWDGLQTIEHLWAAAPALQIVISTAYSDHSWSEIHGRLGRSDSLLILKKPFEAIEARQMAFALAEKWGLARASEAQLASLREVNRELELEIERRRQAEARLTHEALHDPLTDLPNRTLLSDRISHSLARAKRDARHIFAILFLDLDDFKVVNDGLGHRCGDRMLVEIGKRLMNCIRLTDCAARDGAPTAGRMGGDEFAVLLDGMNSRDQVEMVAERVLQSLSEPLIIDGHELRPSVSIGVVHGSAEYDDADLLLRDADTALYSAKSSGKARIALFDQSMREKALHRLHIESELRQAISENQLFLQYQPIVELESGRTAGLEALVRWRHPKHGVIPPGEFVPIAEATGLILPLGEWVLRSACAQVADWRRRLPQASRLFVNVNFSTRQLLVPNFVGHLLAVFAEAGLERDGINIELTESLLMQNVALADRVLQDMRDEHLSLHLDDFGTGFSSLAYLDRLPIAGLKLDKGFLRNAERSNAHIATMRAAIQMGHAHGIKVIAEGIELPEQLALMRSLGCDLGQGFLFSPALDVARIEQRLERENGLPEAA